ncbi:MAG: glycosyltransferase, partial [Lachnospiraceae bacterium]|nr:glycosyltransferase [Lachnospiraceae bacterium]
MILQHFIFPKEDICTESELYIRKEQGAFDVEEQGISMEGEGNYSFFTYFNSFSIGKWMYYTKVSDITFCAEVKGVGMIRLYQAVLQDQQIIRREIKQQEYQSSDCQEIRISVPGEIQDGILYVEVETAERTYLKNARFETSQSKSREVSIAVGICTFKREEYIRKTLQNLQSTFFDQPESALYGHLHVYVSDNGNTLPYETINGEYVRCYPNKNAGGASGFTRALLEALKDQEKRQYTHFLFMDDDISIEPEAIYRTYSLL